MAVLSTPIRNGLANPPIAPDIVIAAIATAIERFGSASWQHQNAGNAAACVATATQRAIIMCVVPVTRASPASAAAHAIIAIAPCPRHSRRRSVRQPIPSMPTMPHR